MNLPARSDRLRLAQDACRVYLIGYMGSGKTTLGRSAAQALGWRFVDLDRLIERLTGRNIPSIFREEGERGFREQERIALRLSDRMHWSVIATGGGVIEDPANIAWMRAHGVVVSLNPPWRTILERTRRHPIANRPVWTSPIEAAVRFRRRSPAYRTADWILDRDENNIEPWIHDLLRTLRGIRLCCSQ